MLGDRCRQGAMGGISRTLLEADAPEKQFDTLRHELNFLVRSYLAAFGSA